MKLVSDVFAAGLFGAVLTGAISFLIFIWRMKVIRKRRPAEIYLERKADVMIELHSTLSKCELLLDQFKRFSEIVDPSQDPHESNRPRTESFSIEVSDKLSERTPYEVGETIEVRGPGLDELESHREDLDEFKQSIKTLESVLSNATIFLREDQAKEINQVLVQARLVFARVNIWFAYSSIADDEKVEHLKGDMLGAYVGINSIIDELDETIQYSKDILEAEINEPIEYFY